MQEHHKSIGKGLLGIVGGASTWLSTHVPDLNAIVQAISFYGGALVVVFSLISLGIDLYRKRKSK